VSKSPSDHRKPKTSLLRIPIENRVSQRVYKGSSLTVARNDSAWASVSSSGAFLPGRGAFFYRVSDVSGHPIPPHGLGKGLVEDGVQMLDGTPRIPSSSLAE
jgi:hypothetical protein